jgi:hypothetical protein
MEFGVLVLERRWRGERGHWCYFGEYEKLMGLERDKGE